MHNAPRSKASALRRSLLLVSLLTVPLGALAALASRDLSNVERTAPTTMGALEIGTAAAVLSAPGNLRIALRTG